jgi:hypothetical protein
MSAGLAALYLFVYLIGFWVLAVALGVHLYRKEEIWDHDLGEAGVSVLLWPVTVVVLVAVGVAVGAALAWDLWRRP